MTGVSEDKLKQRAAGELEAARRALKESETLLAAGQYEGAVSRGYYAIFHAARAALYWQGSTPITHRGVQSEFAQKLVQPGKIEKEFGDILRFARDERQVADYESGEKELLADEETAREVAAAATRFIERVRLIIK